jgi:Tfp pilus assembly protein PilF
MGPYAGRSAAIALGALSALVLVAGCPRPGEPADPGGQSDTRLELAKDYLRHGDFVSAEGQARKALELDEKKVEALNVLGLIDYLRAVNNFKLLEVDDCLTGVDAEQLRQEMDQFLGRADHQFARALALDADYGDAWANRGLVAFHLDQYGAAVRYLSLALAHPQRLGNIGLTRADLGWAYFHQRDVARAAKELRQAEQFNRGMCVANYRLGRVYVARREWSKAREQLEAVSADRTCPIQEAQLYLGQTYKALGLTDQVPGVQKRCTEMAPRSCIAARCRSL